MSRWCVPRAAVRGVYRGESCGDDDFRIVHAVGRAAVTRRSVPGRDRRAWASPSGRGSCAGNSRFGEVEHGVGRLRWCGDDQTRCQDRQRARQARWAPCCRARHRVGVSSSAVGFPALGRRAGNASETPPVGRHNDRGARGAARSDAGARCRGVPRSSSPTSWRTMSTIGT